jgi:CBS domain containing-hemolysin-like protein
MDNSYILIAITLAFSFFFSGIEIAFLSANKLQIELQGKQGVLWGKIMSYFLKRQSWFIGTTLIGNTLALVLFGIYMAQLIEPWLASNLPQSINDEVFILIFQTLISTLLILFTAEFLP